MFSACADYHSGPVMEDVMIDVRIPGSSEGVEIEFVLRNDLRACFGCWRAGFREVGGR